MCHNHDFQAPAASHLEQEEGQEPSAWVQLLYSALIKQKIKGKSPWPEISARLCLHKKQLDSSWLVNSVANPSMRGQHRSPETT